MSNHPMPDIEPLLKNLRLSGMIESLAQRNKEAIDNKMSFTEFLASLLQDEIQRRDMKKFAVRFKKSKINGSKTLEQFDFGFNPKINQQKIKDIATCRFINEKVPVLIVGPLRHRQKPSGSGHCPLRGEIRNRCVILYPNAIVQTLASGQSHWRI